MPKVTEKYIQKLLGDFMTRELMGIVNHCYKKLPLMEWYVPKTQLKTLETTLLYLLGLEEQL